MYAKTFDKTKVPLLKSLGLPVLHITDWKPLHRGPCACASCESPRNQHSGPEYWMTDGGKLDVEMAKRLGFEVWQYNHSVGQMEML